MRLSIIIPVYNGAKEIGRCLDSIYSQALTEDQFEVICVDDASPDESTAEAVRSYHHNRSTPPDNLLLIRHLANKRQGGARNTGIRNATGDYIMFMDHDDVLLPNVLDKIYLALRNEPSLDVMMYDMQETKLGTTRNHVYAKNHTQTVDGISFLKSNEMTYAAWLYAVKRSYIIDNNLWFIENKQFEDGDWCMRLLLGAKKVKYIPVVAYHYIIHSNSTTSIQAGANNITDAFESVLRWEELYNEYHNQDEVLAEILKSHWLTGAVACSYRLIHTDSLSQKVKLLKHYYSRRYKVEHGMYLYMLSRFTTASAFMIHLMLPFLRIRLKQKHKSRR